MESTWGVHGECIESEWRVHGDCMDSAWRVQELSQILLCNDHYLLSMYILIGLHILIMQTHMLRTN